MKKQRTHSDAYREEAFSLRQHWFVDNKLHWSLDVALREGDCKIHRGQAAENLARVRHIALNYLKGEKRFKGGIRRKQKKAALDDTSGKTHEKLLYDGLRSALPVGANVVI